MPEVKPDIIAARILDESTTSLNGNVEELKPLQKELLDPHNINIALHILKILNELQVKGSSLCVKNENEQTPSYAICKAKQ